MTLKEFSEIKHSIRTQEYRARLKALEAKRSKYDIIRDMGTKAKNAVALSLAVAGAIAAPLRSNASPDALRGGGQKPRLAA